ncbi:MAG: aldo/keto reductase [Verrucomicrobiota bacterium]|jgi:predicted aldo/keto reductase-like oxidoreductase
MKDNNVSRRDFVKTLGVMGIGSVVGVGQAFAQSNAPAAASATTPLKPVKVPTRPFGRTGIQVSMLALGGIFDIESNQLVLKQAMDWGVTYWDTAAGYNGGRSEGGIGMYLEKNPQVRRDIFLVTKYDGGGLTEALNQSLEKLKTDYVDMYFLHGSTGGFKADTKAWVEKMKAAKKIRFFGFSTHSNMENDLQAAAKAGWIDGIMLKYDFGLMQTDAMKAAMDAATKAGIGLTAMKTQGGATIKTETEADLKMGGHFIQRGFTQHQAKLKALWENPQIATICSQMPSTTILQANVAAALDKTTLTAADHAALREYAEATLSRQCAGCTRFCEAAPGHQAPIGDVMRALMYHRSYGDHDLARTTFRQLPEAARRGLAGFDYAAAERACPHGLPIAQQMREAGELFA